MAQLTDPACTVQHVRLFHNSPQQTEQLLRALAANHSVTQLFVGAVEGEGGAALAAFLARSSCCLRQLQLQQLSEPEATLRGIGEALRTNTSLTSLQLTGCSCRAGLQVLASAVAGRASGPLSALHFRRCCLNEPAAVALVECVASGTVVLEASECKIVDTALGAMLQQARVLRRSIGVALTLQSLDLSSNCICAAGCRSLAQLLAECCLLTCLVLAGNAGLGDEGAAALADGLMSSGSLVQLDLSACGIGAGGCAALAAAVARPGGSVRQLLLGSNHVGAAGLVALASALWEQQQQPGGAGGLQHLCLEHNSISGAELRGGAAAAPAVSAPLRVVSLARNALGDDGVAWLGQMLAACGTLAELDVSEASFGDAGAGHLVSLLAAHPELSSLVCCGNHLLGGGHRLCTAASLHPGLRKFRGGDSRVADLALRARMVEVTKEIDSRVAAPAHHWQGGGLSTPGGQGGALCCSSVQPMPSSAESAEQGKHSLERVRSGDSANESEHSSRPPHVPAGSGRSSQAGASCSSPSPSDTALGDGRLRCSDGTGVPQLQGEPTLRVVSSAYSTSTWIKEGPPEADKYLGAQTYQPASGRAASREGNSPSSWNSYSQRFKPLSVEQQACFVDF